MADISKHVMCNCARKINRKFPPRDVSVGVEMDTYRTIRPIRKTYISGHIGRYKRMRLVRARGCGPVYGPYNCYSQVPFLSKTTLKPSVLQKLKPYKREGERTRHSLRNAADTASTLPLPAAPAPAPAGSTVYQTRSYSAPSDGELLDVLRSEINHEESTNRFKGHQGGSLGNYSIDWDGSQSEDVFIKRKYGKEDIAVSALLGPEDVQSKGSLPRKVLMKVFVSKQGLTPILQFDCGISVQDDGKSDFYIDNASCLSRPTDLGTSKYGGPVFRRLDSQLQKALKTYLIDRGITTEFTDYLLLHLHEKEQAQYVSWLHKLKRMISQGA
ncbi:hypothetical protein H6P81_007658 [Aristolochia fimbriata]|uniref:Mitochondrial glycoprotein n=1 Tax=Aristolochia fimbriata TaxID=158543 RepID=A0AAV7F1I2_ARIFI|nr:hypothetical protein H6P81_007658 [Aristolochia fimbriata]